MWDNILFYHFENVMEPFILNIPKQAVTFKNIPCWRERSHDFIFILFIFSIVVFCLVNTFVHSIPCESFVCYFLSIKKKKKGHMMPRV